MPLLNLLVTEPFLPPLPEADWVVFSHREECFTKEEAPRMLKAACRYAQKYQVYLVPGRFDAQGCLGSCLVSPQGEILGGQRAVHLTAAQRGRFERSQDLRIFETPYGKVFLAVDGDLLHPEISRAAALAGAQFILGGLYLPGGDYSPMQRVCGAYSAAQQNGVFVLDANNLVTTLAAPAGPDAPDGYLLRDGDRLPQLLTFNPDKAPGISPQAKPEENFVRKYASQLGRC